MATQQASAGASTGRPPHASVGSTVAGRDEQMFGAAFDGRVISRFLGFVRPYRALLIISVAVVLGFTLTSLAVPIIIQGAIDGPITDGDPGSLRKYAIAFFVVIGLNYLFNFVEGAGQTL